MWKKWNNQTTIHHKTIINRMLTSIEVQKVINKHNSTTISTKISKFNKNSQYQLQRPYNTMQATRLLQHNNPPNTIIIITNIECLQSIEVQFFIK